MQKINATPKKYAPKKSCAELGINYGKHIYLAYWPEQQFSRAFSLQLTGAKIRLLYFSNYGTKIANNIATQAQLPSKSLSFDTIHILKHEEVTGVDD
ncbi:hypothetical protein [Paradesulfitobacterium ferrireducens]|uniref:hypothetical protein n=1 Tax=Paradesulfitobacterium ferrireducens TaxID=2816476 RepID=UPI001A8F41BB|nr:hypothetical protein [Paradesulfitobacterium ferrireducens]